MNTNFTSEPIPARCTAYDVSAVIQSSAGLTTESLHAIAALERRCIGVDGGRLKLEWRTLRSRPGNEVNDLLWWDTSSGLLVGFLGLYCFDSRNVELVGMVDPASRRTGKATALLDAAMGLCRERSSASVLLVVPRNSEAGRYLALGRGGVLDHSEYALVLEGATSGGPSGPDVHTRPTQLADVQEIARILTAAFGGVADDAVERVIADLPRSLSIEVAGHLVGTVRIERDGTTGGIYGFAVDPQQQGRGIGRQALRQICNHLRAEGIERIGLEVATQNENALGLYTSLGFKPVTTEDYFALAM